MRTSIQSLPAPHDLIFIAGLLIILLLAGGLLISQLQQRNSATQQSQLRRDTTTAQAAFERRLSANLDYFELLADEQVRGNLNADTFQARVSQYIHDHPELINVTWADAEFIIRWTAPIESNKQVLGLKLSLPEPARASQQARASRRPAYTQPFTIIQGSTAIEVYVPVFNGNEFLGTVGGVYTTQGLVQHAVIPQLLETYQITLLDQSGVALAQHSPQDLIPTRLTQRVALRVPETRLQLQLIRYQQTVGWSITALGSLIIGFTVILAYSWWRLYHLARMQHQTTQALQNSDAHFRSLVEGSIQGILIHRDWQPVFVNQAYTHIFGYESPEVFVQIPDILSRIVAWPEQAHLRQQAQNHLQGLDTPVEHEYQGVRQDGRTIWLLNMVRVISWEGEPAIQSTIIDITARRQAEDKLNKWRALLHADGWGMASLSSGNDPSHVLPETLLGEDSHPSCPTDEPRHLDSLHQTGLLDQAAAPLFDRLTVMACRMLPAPVALISLIDRNRQFFYSHYGLPKPWASKQETPLSHSFCQYVVASAKPFIVRDAYSHPMVCDNLALKELGVIAYLGVPLRTPDGEVIGSLCAIDNRPRNWLEEDLASLEDLAAIAMREIERQWHLKQRQAAENALQESETRFRNMIETSPNLIWMSGLENGCTYFNQQWLTFTGRTLSQEMGMGWVENLHPDDREHCLQTYLTAFEDHQPCSLSYRLRRWDGQYRWVLSQGIPQFQADGVCIGYMGSCIDITAQTEAQQALTQSRDDLEKQVKTRTAILHQTNAALRRALAERDQLEHHMLSMTEREQRRLGQELHDGLCQELTSLSFLSYRIETNLQAQQHADAVNQAQLTQALRDVIKQTRNLAKGFYPTELETDGLEAALAVLAIHTEKTYNLKVNLIADPTWVSPHAAIRLHLYRIVQEAVMNAVKHAGAKSLFIRLARTPTGIALSVTDDGQGLPQSQQPSSGMGLHIMRYRSQLIGAQLTIDSNTEGGTRVMCSLDMLEDQVHTGRWQSG